MVDLGIIMDPLATINLKKDSTLAMIRSAQARGWKVWFIAHDSLHLREHQVLAEMAPIELTEPFFPTLDPALAGDQWYTLGEMTNRPLGELDAVLQRKDPPFDMEYIYATYLLERAEQQGVKVFNRPDSLRDCNEKLFATEFTECCPPLIVSRRAETIKAFAAEHGDVVLKPLDGMGGKSIFRIVRGDQNLSVVIETLTDLGQRQIMAQKYLPEIKDGDKRILMIDGEPLDYALARIPMAGEARGNLAAGGTGEGRPLTDRDRWIARQVGPELRKRGLYFVGMDVIGDYLTEVNVTCPTCIRELDAQFDLDIAEQFVAVVERELRA